MKQIGMAEIKLTDNEIEAAVCVLQSGALRQGKECEAFEQEFAQHVGAKHAITNSSGTAALHLSYMAFLKPGEEVLVPSFTFIATGSMVTLTGGKPIFCDVNPKTFLIDLEDAAQKITPKTKAIAPVHLFGNPCDFDKIKKFADQHSLKIVWDAAQAHGAKYKGRDIGSFDDFVCYSFYPSKNMFVGEGGMVCTDNDKYANQLRFLRSHGQTGKYYHTMVGLNYRMTDVEAAIGREQLKRLDDMLNVRRRNATILNEALSEIDGLQPQEQTPESEHAWHQYCIVVNPKRFGSDRDTLAVRLKKLGVSTGVHYPRGLHQQPIFEELYNKQHLPNTELLTSRILALPVHHGLSEDNVNTIVKALKKSQS